MDFSVELSVEFSVRFHSRFGLVRAPIGVRGRRAPQPLRSGGFARMRLGVIDVGDP
jgi:hypothetical protein